MNKSKYIQSRFKYDNTRKKVWQAVVFYLQNKFFKKTNAVLDIASGYGDLINSVKATKKVAIDLDSSYSKFYDKSVNFINSNILKFNFSKIGKFDVIFCSNIIEHLSQEEGKILLIKLRDILNPNGLIIIIQPNFKYCYKSYFDDYTHQSIYTDVSMMGLLKSLNFKIQNCRPKFLPFSLNSFLPKTYFLTFIYIKLHFSLFSGQMMIVAKKN